MGLKIKMLIEIEIEMLMSEYSKRFMATLLSFTVLRYVKCWFNLNYYWLKADIIEFLSSSAYTLRLVVKD